MYSSHLYFTLSKQIKVRSSTSRERIVDLLDEIPFPSSFQVKGMVLVFPLSLSKAYQWNFKYISQDLSLCVTLVCFEISRMASESKTDDSSVESNFTETAETPYGCSHYQRKCAFVVSWIRDTYLTI